jgi:menaquinone-dependent protoporphyrinogen oxidase
MLMQTTEYSSLSPLPPPSPARAGEGALGALPIFYATRDGHTRKIAARVAARLNAAGRAAKETNLDEDFPSPETLKNLPFFILIAAIRYGHHLPQAERVLDVYLATDNRPPLALASICLTARKPNKNKPETNPYMRKWIKRRKLKPLVAAVFAGMLDYPRYGMFDRLMIRLIMTITGGETNPTARIEYTHWPSVDSFADDIARRLPLSEGIRQ